MAKDPIPRLTPAALRRISKFLVQQCFRTVLEDIHAGIDPHTEVGDYSDVIVKTPTGEIPWPKLSRITDPEMQQLMREAVDKTYALLRMLFNETKGNIFLDFVRSTDLVAVWDNPRPRKLTFRQKRKDG